jgi:hypothetical protein
MVLVSNKVLICDDGAKMIPIGAQVKPLRIGGMQVAAAHWMMWELEKEVLNLHPQCK